MYFHLQLKLGFLRSRNYPRRAYVFIFLCTLLEDFIFPAELCVEVKGYFGFNFEQNITIKYKLTNTMYKYNPNSF